MTTTTDKIAKQITEAVGRLEIERDEYKDKYFRMAGVLERIKVVLEDAIGDIHFETSGRESWEKALEARKEER
jgi:hypothetical protein